jgi:hypothetical protein
MNWDTIQQVVRIGAGWLGSALMAKGVLDASNAELLTGVILNGGQILWWIFWQKNRAE